MYTKKQKKKKERQKKGRKGLKWFGMMCLKGCLLSSQIPI